MVMRTQQNMTGRPKTTVAEVEDGWVKRARQPFAERDDEIGLVDLSTNEAIPAVEAYVNWGRWVADCPMCNGGIACWVENPKGACLSCGRIYRVAYPQAWETIEALLEKRERKHQHWFPEETVEWLAVENLRHGIAP